MLKQHVVVRTLLSIGAAALVGTPSVGAAQTTYRIVDIGALPGDTQSVPHDINDAGEVVGISGSNKLFRWSQSQGMRNPGITVEAPYFFFRQPPTILRVNNRGTAVGPNFVQRLNDTVPHYRANVCIPSCYVGIGFGGINDKDEVAVTSMATNSYVSLIYKAREKTYELGPFLYLWPAYTYAYNNSGMIAGGMFDRRPGSGTGAKVEGFLANPFPTRITIGQAGINSESFDLNSRGETVGQDANKPFYYSPTTGHYYISNVSGVAHGINEAGQVVGAVGGRAFIWTKDGGLNYLDAAIDPRDPSAGSARFTAARAINNLGQIVAINQNTGKAVLLVPAIEIVDAAPEFVSGTKTVAYTDSVATGGRPVSGVTTDGAATLILKIPTASVGQQVTVQHPDAPACHAGGIPGATAVDVCGALGGLGGDPIATFYTATAISTPRGPMAFVVYRAPSDFAWSSEHKALAFRDLELKVLETGEPIKLKVVRPPVMYVHGLWDSGSGNSKIKSALLSDVRLTADVVDYGNQTQSVCGVSPPSIADGTLVPGSALGFEYGAQKTLEKIDEALEKFRRGSNRAQLNIAAAKVILVGHSMGALVSRYLQHINGYRSPKNMGTGAVHKLVSVAGPHLGSPFAAELLRNKRPQDNGKTNECIREQFNVRKSYVIESYYEGDASSCGRQKRLSGAVGDLAGSGNGDVLSVALKKLKSGGSIPVAYIAGQMSARATSALSASGPATVGDQSSQLLSYSHQGIKYLIPTGNLNQLKSFCSYPLFLNFDDLPQYITAARFPTLMGDSSDGIVPVVSQRAGVSQYINLNAGANVEPTGLVHSPGSAELGFGVIDLSGSSIVKTLTGDEAAMSVLMLIDVPTVSPTYVKGQ